MMDNLKEFMPYTGIYRDNIVKMSSIVEKIVQLSGGTRK